MHRVRTACAKMNLPTVAAISVVVLLSLAAAPSASASRPTTAVLAVSSKPPSILRGVGAALASALGLGSSHDTDVDKPPWFCHGIDCPRFKTVDNTDAFETRVYPAGLKWTSTVVTGVKYDEAVSTGFMRLFHYIGGENEAKAKVPMTAPVRVRVTPGFGPFCESNFTVSFFVPFVEGEPGTQIDPPEPTNPDVFSETDADAFTAYVASFGGWADERKLLREARSLGDTLVRAGKRAAGEGGDFFFAGYDAPFRVLGRHNEVWYTAPAT